MSKKGITIILFCWLSTKCVYSQFSETIRTGRPGQEIGAYSISKNVLQFQQGLEYNELINNPSNSTAIITNHVIRFDILEKLELNALLDYQ